MMPRSTSGGPAPCRRTRVPENYSARVETGTVNGGVNTDFPVTVQGKITKQLALNLGAGGAMVRAMTTNGGVHLKKLTGND